MGFVSFMASGAGRLLRAIAGLALIAGGVALVMAQSLVGGVVLIVVGLLPLAAGAFDFCVFAPLFGAPLSGVRIRARQ
jgi:hypothetical protein